MPEHGDRARVSRARQEEGTPPGPDGSTEEPGAPGPSGAGDPRAPAAGTEDPGATDPEGRGLDGLLAGVSGYHEGHEETDPRTGADPADGGTTAAAGPGHPRPRGGEGDADDGDRYRFPFGRPGRPLRRSSPFVIGFTGGLGVLLAIGLTRALATSSQVLILIVVSMFLAVGLNPAVEALARRGMRRGFAVATVFLGLLGIFVGFGFAIAPPLAEQSGAFVTNLPDYLDRLQGNPTIERLDREFGLIDRAREYVLSDSLPQQAFGGIVGVGKVVLSAAFSAFTILILTLYFLGSLPAIKQACYELVPRSRRERVRLLGDEILSRIGGYVSGAMIVATCAGVSTYVFLQIVGLREFALALALLVALFDLIPMVGATLGAIVVTLVGFLDSVTLGVACFVFYVAYQQFENYLIYPRVMRRSVDVPPALTIVAALLGGTLLGVVGALLAIPTAAAVLLVFREVVIPRQEQA